MVFCTDFNKGMNMQTMLNDHFEFIIGFVCGWIFVKSVRMILDVVDNKSKQRQRMNDLIRQAVQTAFNENE